MQALWLSRWSHAPFLVLGTLRCTVTGSTNPTAVDLYCEGTLQHVDIWHSFWDVLLKAGDYVTACVNLFAPPPLNEHVGLSTSAYFWVLYLQTLDKAKLSVSSKAWDQLVSSNPALDFWGDQPLFCGGCHGCVVPLFWVSEGSFFFLISTSSPTL